MSRRSHFRGTLRRQESTQSIRYRHDTTRIAKTVAKSVPYKIGLCSGNGNGIELRGVSSWHYH